MLNPIVDKLYEGCQIINCIDIVSLACSQGNAFKKLIESLVFDYIDEIEYAYNDILC